MQAQENELTDLFEDDSNTFINQEGVSDEAIEQTGSSCDLGRFKDTSALLKAYNELNKEFTRKCQQLSTLINDKEEIIGGTIEASTPLPDISVNEQSNGIIEISTPDNSIDTQLADLYKLYPKAANYHTQLVNNLSNNPESSCTLKSAKLAYLDLLQADTSLDSLVTNDKFLSEYIYNNQSVVDTIVRNYLSALSSQQAPTVISHKGAINLTPPHKPSTIAEASEMAVKFFK